MARGDILYACRRCKAEFSLATVPDLMASLVSLAAIGRDGEVTDRAIHYCDDARRGVADLVGGDLTPADRSD